MYMYLRLSPELLRRHPSELSILKHAVMQHSECYKHNQRQVQYPGQSTKYMYSLSTCQLHIGHLFKTKLLSYCSFTNTAAMPIPDPMHMLVTKIFAPVSFAIE